MEPIHVGLVADPASPTEIARRMSDLDPPSGEGGGDAWDIEVVSEPFTIGSDDVDTAVARLRDQARQHEWDLVVGLTELPLHDDDGRYLLIEADPQRRTAVLSLPALGGLRMHTRTRHAVRKVVRGMADPTSEDELRVPPLRGRWRLLLGMVLANRPWLLVPGSSPRSSRHWPPEPSPRSTPPFGYWPAPCLGGASWSRRSRPSRSSSAGS